MLRIKLMIISLLFAVIWSGIEACCENYNTIQNFTLYRQEGTAVHFECRSDKGEKVFVKIDICAEDMFRIRTSSLPVTRKEEHLVIKEDWKPVRFELSEEQNCILIKTNKLTLRIKKEPFRIGILNLKDELIINENQGGMKFFKSRISISIESDPEEHFFGFGAGRGVGGRSGFEGEYFNRLDKRGQNFVIDGRRIPFFMSTKGYGIFLNTICAARFDMTSGGYGLCTFETEENQIDYYFIYGPGFKHILGSYTELTGRAPLIPKWAFGARQAGYWDQKEVETYCKMYRDKNIPCDLIHIDSGWLNKCTDYSGHGLHYGDNPCGYVDFKWDRRQFPYPEKMISKVKNQGFKLSLWETALVNPNVGEFYEQGAEKGYFVNNRDGLVSLVPYGTRGPSAVVDFSNPDTREWWKQQHKRLINMGINSFKMDISGNMSRLKDAKYYSGKPLSQMHVLYKLWNLKTVFSAVEEYTGKRGYIFSSIATASTQRYPVHWSGDYHLNFYGLESVIRNAQNMGLSGFAYYSVDFPAAFGIDDPELYIRWMQFGFLSALCQSWCGLPWQFGKEVEDIHRLYAKLRYQLIPYIYSYAWEAHKTGVPIVRAMVLEYQNDPNIYNKDLQYMLGRELLVAPVYQASVSEDQSSVRIIYLPEGEWTDYWTGERYKGSKNICYETAFNRIPIFVKAGAIIPMGPVVNYMGEKSVDPLKLDIYPSETSNFTLYEDDGETKDYEEGDFTLVDFVCKQKEDGIIVDIGKSKGDFKGRLRSRSYVLKVNHVCLPKDVKIEEKAIRQYRSENFENKRIGWSYDSSKKVVLIKIGNIQADIGASIYLEGAILAENSR